PDNGFILLGSYNDYNGNEHRIHLFKFDSTGSLEWHKFYLPDSLGFFDNATNLSGDSTGVSIIGYIYYPLPGQTGGWLRPYFIRTDLEGNELWSNVYTDNGYYIGDAWGTVKDKFGSFYFVGYHNSGSSGENPYLIKLDSNGNNVFNRDLIDSAEGGDATSILMVHDTTLIIHGGWTLPNVDTVHCGVIKCDTLGNVITTKKLPLYSRGWYSTQTFDDKMLFLDMGEISGHSVMALSKLNLNLEYDSVYNQPRVYDSLCPGGIISDTLNPDCNLVVNIDEPRTNPETTCLKIFPNPSHGTVTVEMPRFLQVNDKGTISSTTFYHQWKSTTLEAYDLDGNKMLSKDILYPTSSVQLDVSGWRKGMYMFRLVFNNRTVSSVKLLVD
ncbi:MAG TPA: T9SS type A sorting domain-containing protein, partial [Methanosarcina sp.]|nr:T9SS type A sorting domain-containing protein [Methanosarcina sp.]